MALTVEDGTGLSSADAYISVADFKTFCDNRGYDYSAFADSVIEQKIRLATEYIDGSWRYRGTRASETQALEFPRSGLTDWSGFTITGLPARVVNACAEGAFIALGEDLTENLDRGGMVKSESIGPISTTYADGAPPHKLYTKLNNFLRQYTRKVDDMAYSPSYVAPADGEFGKNLHEYPGAASTTSDDS